MLFSLAVILLCGITLGGLCKRLRLPPLVGMLVIGIIIGPYSLNLIDGSILNISSQLRQIALVIILTRAGLALNLKDLAKVKRSAILLCFVPACFEIVGVMVACKLLFNLPLLDGAIAGAVLAAVSPAVVVPKMLQLMEEGYGTNNGIPQIIMAGASLDDIFVIVLFSSLLTLSNGEGISLYTAIVIPTAIIFGLAVGIVCGIILVFIFRKLQLRDSVKAVILLCVAFLLVSLEGALSGIVGFSGLLAVTCMGGTVNRVDGRISARLSGKLAKLWIVAEVLLFVLVGATVDISYAITAGVMLIILLFIGLICRAVGVMLSFARSDLSRKERLFCVFAYLPKATVQAAIGSIPLSMGLNCGRMVLTVAVLAIIISAPLGSLLIERSYKKLLHSGNSQK